MNKKGWTDLFGVRYIKVWVYMKKSCATLSRWMLDIVEGPQKLPPPHLVMSPQALTNHLPNIINCSKNDIILSFVSEKVLLVGRSRLNIRQCSITFQSKYMFEPIGYWSFWFSCVCEIIYIYINICSTTTWMLRAIIKTNVRNKKLWFICL